MTPTPAKPDIRRLTLRRVLVVIVAVAALLAPPVAADEVPGDLRAESTSSATASAREAIDRAHPPEIVDAGFVVRLYVSDGSPRSFAEEGNPTIHTTGVLPAGSYLIHATASVTGRAAADCTLLAGGSEFGGVGYSIGAGSGNLASVGDRMTFLVNVSMPVTLRDPSAAELRCHSAPSLANPMPWSVAGIRIVAHEVGEIVSN